ncbi:MAG: hypothetical protein N2379_10595, partial [Verrucomicrobiae bacterium]|nr:hypothetical protein [Verrucomicrobiae bacterium]
MNRHALFRRPRTWHLLGVVGIIIGLGIVAFLTRAQWVPRLVYHRPLRYDVPFHAAIAKADKIVVRGGSGFDCCGKVDESNVLF